jgi:hypothetical protein
MCSGEANCDYEMYPADREYEPMNSSAETLDNLMRETLQEGGYAVSGGRDLYMEVMDTTTGLVWMSVAPVELSDYESLELDDSLVKIGIARAAMDSAAFQYSPGAPDEPVLERVIDGRSYINVAIPPPPQEWVAPSQPGGPTEILVDKSHLIGFEAGRSVTILSLPDGDFVELVGEPEGDDALVLPAGGSLREVLLEQPWVVQLPSPTRTFFWFGDSMRSFQGPVSLP